jgi:Skp family chaperone for outer membrane proteins
MLLAPAPARAADPPKPEPTIGYIDSEKLVEAYQKTPGWSTRMRTLEAEQGKIKEQMRVLNQTRYLTSPERAEWESLRAKPKPTDTEKERLKSLEQKSDGLDAEFNRLAQVEKPSPDQEKRLKELDDVRRSGLVQAEEAASTLLERAQKLETDLADELRQAIHRAVEKVAQRRKLSVVVDRRLVFFGGVDITPEILKQVQ